jgi:hypothetical protein
MNRIRQPEVNQEKVKKEKTSVLSASKLLNAIDNISILPGQNFSARLIPYTLFMLGIALVYIANSYYSEKTVREIDKIGRELKTLRSEYISGRSELMFNSKQSEVAKSVAPLGVVESTEAPRKIVLRTYKTEEED